jgi:hypothetical protein
LYRPVETDGSGTGAIVGATAAVPAFIGMKYYRRFAFIRIRNINIYLADFHTGIASGADIGIKDYRCVRGDYIR